MPMLDIHTQHAHRIPPASYAHAGEARWSRLVTIPARQMRAHIASAVAAYVTEGPTVQYAKQAAHRVRSVARSLRVSETYREEVR